ncbi:Uncharacterized protein FKW44_006373, partial [Caligus rogercresseyi]
MEQARRTTICELRRAGHRAAAIFKMTQYNRKTVYNVVKAFDEEGKTTRKDHRLKRSIRRTPTTKMTKLAKDRNVSHTTIRRAVKDDLNIDLAQNKADRVSKGRKILNDRRARDITCFYSDEKYSCRNVRKPPKRPLDLPGPQGGQADHVQQETVRGHDVGGHQQRGGVMVPHFFQANETVNKT